MCHADSGRRKDDAKCLAAYGSKIKETWVSPGPHYADGCVIVFANLASLRENRISWQYPANPGKIKLANSATDSKNSKAPLALRLAIPEVQDSHR